MMSARRLQSCHRAPKPLCDLFSEEVVAWCSSKLSSRILEQVVDALEFLSFLRLVLSAPGSISLGSSLFPLNYLQIFFIRSSGLPQWSASMSRISLTLIRVLVLFITGGAPAMVTRGRRECPLGSILRLVSERVTSI